MLSDKYCYMIETKLQLCYITFIYYLCACFLVFFFLSWPAHEKAVGSLARRLGFTQVSLSSEVMPMIRAVPRGYTVCADAYLTPKIHQYLKGFIAGFKGELEVSVFVYKECNFY